MNYSAVSKETKKVVNNIEWDGQSDLDPYWTTECDMIPWDNNTIGYPVNRDYNYDETAGAFYPDAPHASWVLNDDFRWEAPVPMPTDEPDGQHYEWDEDTVSWVLVDNPVDPQV